MSTRTAFLAILTLPLVCAADPVTLDVKPLHAANESAASSETLLPLMFPEEAPAKLRTEKKLWGGFDTLSLSLAVPSDAPTNTQVLVYVIDWDGFWYQKLVPGYLETGTTNSFTVDVSAYAEGWEAKGHHGVWNRRSLMRPNEVGFRVFCPGSYTGLCTVVSASADGTPPKDPPRISRVRAAENVVPVDGRYELRFDLSDRYTNPFDTREIAVDATIVAPSGNIVTVPCFYYQAYNRTLSAAGEVIEPQGRPEWRLRYSPEEPGEHTVTLSAKDKLGTSVWERAVFTATPAEPGSLRRVRVSEKSPYMFEKDDDTPFYPIGFNIRSPYDARMDHNFPDRFRHQEGTLAYDRYFSDMGKNGLSFAEIWSSAWCMGLEWKPTQLGYHGIGQFNMVHAWERDQVFASAARNGVYINLVLNNHGRTSAYCDPEWQDNPYNSANGGFLDDPLQWFADERAVSRYMDQLRYEVARYGWNANLFAWELWSELDLTGFGGGEPHKDYRVVEWHRRMSEYLKKIDPRHHLVSTHFSTNYSRQSPPLCSMPTLTHCCIDAYHDGDSLNLFQLIQGGAAQNEMYKKPLLITEFGGSPNGSDLRSLRNQLHVALWSAPANSYAGSPMFWWWHVVEEADLYPLYAGFARFMKDADPRVGEHRLQGLWLPKPETCTNQVGNLVGSLCASLDRGFAWFCVDNGYLFETLDPSGPKLHTDFKLELDTVPEKGTLRAEFWDTVKGEPAENGKIDLRIKHNKVEIPIPPFARDIALKYVILPYTDAEPEEEK